MTATVAQFTMAGTPLDAAKRGDHAAFAAIVRAQQAMVFSIALHATRNRATAEELAQDVFLQLYRTLEGIESEEHLVRWLRRAATNRCIDHLRRLSELPLPEGVDIAAPGEPDRDVLLHRRLRWAVAGLPPQQRLAVILRYQEELEPHEISEALDVPVNTIKSHLQRALGTIRRNLGMPGPALRVVSGENRR